METIALNTTTQPRRAKRSTVKAKTMRIPSNTKANIEHPTPLVPSTQSTNAKRLVSTKGLSREDWLAVRKQGVGSSDAAAACGIHPY